MDDNISNINQTDKEKMLDKEEEIDNEKKKDKKITLQKMRKNYK